MSVGAVGLTLVPPEPATPADHEAAVRGEFQRALGWGVRVGTPPWREVLFLGKPRPLSLPHVPGGIVDRLRNLRQESFAPTPIGLEALALAEKLSSALPTGVVPRSMGAARTLAAPRDAVSTWERMAILAATGPAIMPLLVSSGALTSDDVDALVEDYPAEVEAQRLAATEGAATVSGAAGRAGNATSLPAWLDDQMLTLMDDDRDTQHFMSLYEPDPGEQKAPGAPSPGPSASGGESRIANQFRPNPSPGST